MIKLIKTGVAPKEKPFKIICLTCNSEYEYLKTDVQVLIAGGQGTAYGFKCVICHTPIVTSHHE
jgi:hypothetical protein